MVMIFAACKSHRQTKPHNQNKTKKVKTEKETNKSSVFPSAEDDELRFDLQLV